MAKQYKKISQNSICRIVVVAVCLVAQVAWFVWQVFLLNNGNGSVALLTEILALLLILRINYKNVNSSMKMPWIMLLMAFPVLGLCLYGLTELLGDLGVGKRLQKVRQDLRQCSANNEDSLPDHVAGQCRYLSQCVGYPVYANTAVNYYAEAADAFADLKKALQQAEHFIFMEYFIIEDGPSFAEVEQILVRKAAEGVQVRLMYDDIGSVGTTNMRLIARLRKQGIHCIPFNPAVPMLHLFMNHRDHRKITVVDGKVAFTGGFNLADEYFGRTRPYGHWKDTGLRLEGAAVQAMTSIFLELWSVQTRQQEDFSVYLQASSDVSAPGYVQPFGDDPLGEERVAENVYLNLIHSAKQRLYLVTPYLIITDEMTHALTMAAGRGVDVRILTPGIPDKKMVYQITQSYYAALVTKGVRIFTYTPGFCHAKMCLCDDHVATVGTSNLDYRSLYHHFENNVLLVDVPAIAEIASDFESMFACSREETRCCSSVGFFLRIWRYILRLFAPLL